MRLTRRALVPAVMLTASVALLQWHAIQFWNQYAGPTGFAWSLLLDAAALWCWSHRQWWMRGLGVVASILTLLGPLYQVASPLLTQVQTANWQATQESQVSEQSSAWKSQEVARLTAQRKTLADSLAVYQSNSQQRPGWLAAIQQTQSALLSVDQQIAALTAPKVAALPADLGASRQAGIIWMEVISLILFQVIAVLATLSLSAVFGKENEKTGKPLSETVSIPRKPVETPKKQAFTGEFSFGSVSTPKPKEPMELATSKLETETLSVAEVTGIAEKLSAYLSRTGTSQGAFAKAHDLSQRDLSFLRNHAKRVAAGERTVPPIFVQKVASLLEAQA